MQFVVGQEYRRSDLHAEYGGSPRNGICTLSKHPMMFLFTGKTGHRYGYRDDFQPDGTFWYTGEGRVGDMEMTRGNRAIRDSAAQAKALHLFERTKSGFVRYVGEAQYLAHHFTTAVDENGKPRQAVVFELALTGSEHFGAPVIIRETPEKYETSLWKRPLDEVRVQAVQALPKEGAVSERRIILRRRSAAVRVYVIRRADGICEGCGNQAPFLRPDGTTYLEPHHIRRLADQGPDHPRWVAALCPNCHRRVHYGQDGAEFNKNIAARIGEIESD